MLLFSLKTLCIMKIVIFLNIFGENHAVGMSRSRTSSTSSSTTSLTAKHQHIETRNPVASTSKANKNKFKQELSLDEAQRLTIGENNINLNEAALATNVEQINPARDGFYASINRILLQYGASAVVGTAVGVGTFEILNRNTSTSPTTETSVSNSNSGSNEENKLL